MNGNPIVTKSLGRLLGFDTYREIVDWVKKDGFYNEKKFRTLFDSYYVVRRSKEWREVYFSYFKTAKENNCNFDEIIDYLYKKTKNNKGGANPVEASFSSKMLATINTDMPILDSQVLKNMNLKIKEGTSQEKLESAKDVYKEICDRYKKYKDTDNCKNAIELFNCYFPDYKDFSETRKIDWFLWAMTKEELKEIGLFGELIDE